MATTTITELRTIGEIKSYLLLAADDTEETFNFSVDLLFNYIKNNLNPTPTGSILMWPAETIPAGYTELDGKSFDAQVFPELGALFPTGKLPDTRGMMLKHAPNGRSVLNFEANAILSHGHNATTRVSSTDLGTKTTNTTGNHTHSFKSSRGEGDYYDSNAQHGTSNATVNTSYAGNHSHTVSIGSHSHSASTTVSAAGGSKNLVDNIAVKYIVKKA